MESKIIASAREINNYKSFWCAEKVQNEMLKFELANGRKPWARKPCGSDVVGVFKGENPVSYSPGAAGPAWYGKYQCYEEELLSRCYVGRQYGAEEQEEIESRQQYDNLAEPHY